MPPDHLLPDRLGSILAVLYLIFNEGYSATAGDAMIRHDLSGDAIRLARVLSDLMPDEAEALGLLALMLRHDSRRATRVGSRGELVLLDEQDRSRWDRAEIEEGVSLLQKALRFGLAGPYQVQAAIAALHAQSDTPAATDWPQIAALYGRLARMSPSPVVELNRAVAVAMAGDLEIGLQLIDRLDSSKALAGYHLLHSARADLLRRLGRSTEAAEAYTRALALTSNAVERAFLQRRMAEVGAQAGAADPGSSDAARSKRSS